VIALGRNTACDVTYGGQDDQALGAHGTGGLRLQGMSKERVSNVDALTTTHEGGYYGIQSALDIGCASALTL
jgi:hypothetical protein